MGSGLASGSGLVSAVIVAVVALGIWVSGIVWWATECLWRGRVLRMIGDLEGGKWASWHDWLLGAAAQGVRGWKPRRVGVEAVDRLAMARVRKAGPCELWAASEYACELSAEARHELQIECAISALELTKHDDSLWAQLVAAIIFARAGLAIRARTTTQAIRRTVSVLDDPKAEFPSHRRVLVSYILRTLKKERYVVEDLIEAFSDGLIMTEEKTIACLPLINSEKRTIREAERVLDGDGSVVARTLALWALTRGATD